MAKGRAEQRRARAGAQILMGTADLTMKPSAPRSCPRPVRWGGVGGRSRCVMLALDPSHCSGAAHCSWACGLLVKEPKEASRSPARPWEACQQDRHPQEPTLSVRTDLRRHHRPHPYQLLVRPTTLLCLGGHHAACDQSTADAADRPPRASRG